MPAFVLSAVPVPVARLSGSLSHARTVALPVPFARCAAARRLLPGSGSTPERVRLSRRRM
jgi:hypothetical protein